MHVRLGARRRSFQVALAAAFAVGLALAFVSSCELVIPLDDLSDKKCPSDQKLCYGKCLPKGNPMTGCALETCAPCVFEHATATCSPTFACAIASCVGDYYHCTSTSCDTDLAHDPNNCGGCNVVCLPKDHAKPGCSDRACAVGGCDTGWEDCNRMYDDGCETNLLSNHDNCGRCGQACAAAETCQNGVCG
jgi:hypothetical protein